MLTPSTAAKAGHEIRKWGKSARGIRLDFVPYFRDREELARDAACMLSGFGGLGHTVVATCCVASMLVAKFWQEVPDSQPSSSREALKHRSDIPALVEQIAARLQNAGGSSEKAGPAV